jgi:predicted ATP-grasp superfamily ATP-dependent carboligase
MVRETGYTGLAMFEFKEDAAGKPRLLEVNPRVWGTFPLTRAAGSVIPQLWCALAWNAGNPDRQAPLPQPEPLPETKMIFAASDLMAALGYARRGRPGEALRALGDFLNPTVRDGLFEWTDILPGLAYYRSLLAKERHP